MALKELMQYVIELGFDGGDAERDSKKSFDKIGDNAEKSTGRFEGIGGKMGKALVAGFAAVGAGALIMQGINTAMDARAGVRRLEGQFALTAEEAKKYGDLAGDLYAEGWGEGVEEVQQVVGLAAKKLGTTTDEELRGISESVLAVSRTWGEDFDAVIRSTDQLIQNDLAPNAEAALDLIVGAFQNGGNEAGDLLDTIDEYSQHWEAMGLSGEDALNQIIHGFQNGQRDADKMADAVKEMRIRIVENTDPVREALQDLGLDADSVVEAFLEGGPAAREAFLEVIDALRDGQEAGDDTANAVAIIGTQFEDLGPKALDSLAAVDGALEDTAGKAKELAETVESSEWETFSRRASQGLGEAAEMFAGAANSLFTEIARDMDGGAVGEMMDIADGLNTARASAEEFDLALLESATSFAEARKLAEEYAASIGLTGEEAQTAANVFALRWNASIEDSGTKSHEAATELSDYRKETNNAMGALEGAYDAGVDVNAMLAEQAEQAGDTAEEIETLAEQFSDLLGDLSDRGDYLNAKDGFDDVQQAAKDAWDAAAEGAEDAERKARDHERAVISLKEDVIAYADEIGNIPPEQVSDIIAMIDQGSLDEAEAKLSQLERLRQVRVNVQTIYSHDDSYKFTPRGGASSGVGTARPFGASGGIVGQRTDNVTLGEAGPEAVIPLDQMPGNKPLGDIGVGGGGITMMPGAVQVTSIGSPTPELERIINKALDDWNRRNGRTR